MLFPIAALVMLSSRQNPDPGAAVSGLQAFSRDFLGGLPMIANKNAVASPFSVSQCLALLLPGVGSSDAAMVAKSLHLPTSVQDAGESVRALNALLAQTPNGEVVVANSVWTGPRYSLTATYKNTVQGQYGAEAATLPDTGAAGVQAVNAWISDKTKGRIKNLLQQLDSSTSAVLVNAVSFDAKWQNPFRADRTTNKPFHAPAGDISVPTMAEKTLMPYAQADGYQIVQMSYASGGYAMLVLLPAPGCDPLKVLRSFDPANIPRMKNTMVELEFPKFKFGARYDLMSALGGLGLSSLTDHFDAGPMLGTSQPMKLSQFLHGAEIDVDENGTRAAAATIAGIRGTAIFQPPQTVQVHVDRPFAFVITQSFTQAPLFEGVVFDPSKS